MINLISTDLIFPGIAQKHRAVMLIDADLRNPTQVRLLGRKAMGKEGLSKLLQSGVSDAGRIAAAAAYDEATNLVTLVNDQPAGTQRSCCPRKAWRVW